MSVLLVAADGYRWFVQFDECPMDKIPTTAVKTMPVDALEDLVEHCHTAHKKTEIAHGPAAQA
jgi:hypothetical protein